jgi:integrase
VRARLAFRREPYWQRVASGRHLGFRHMTRGKPGTWLARAYTDRGYVYETLGDLAELPERERYDTARKHADRWFSHLDMGGSARPSTVRAACEAYVERIRVERSVEAARNAEGFFRRFVFGDAIADIVLSRLTKTQMSDWRRRMLERNPNRSSFNRNVTPLRAALNQAHEQGSVATDQAWLVALKPFAKRDGGGGVPRTLYLDRGRRRALIDRASAEARPFLTALALLPMRPGELAKLRVQDFDGGQGVLRPEGKTGRRVIPLSREAVLHFSQCSRSKLPGAWLISRSDGSPWKKEGWRDEVKSAAQAADLPRETVAYTLRHSVITDLVTGGLDLFTVAKLAGTSVGIIEQHYGHLQREHARAALEKLALG